MSQKAETFRKLAWMAGLSFCATAGAVEFGKDIEPILNEHCLDCHGPEKEKSALRVDSRPSLLRGGDSGLAAIVPGDPEKSYLIEVVRGGDPDMTMPPKGDLLTGEQVALLEEWIKGGAEWPGQMNAKLELSTDHWSFQPVVRPEPPSGDGNPVDRFLDRKLEENGIVANVAADPRSLIRRAAITLTGLPPTPERVEAFQTAFVEKGDMAYLELVDELLASPHFGERWAQHWLDVIRWAETNGSEANLYRKNAWVYRDYVIRAFNEDVPYDLFVREQLAGDTLGVGEATGFLVAGPHAPAATVGAQPTAIREARADRMDEVMQTVGASMMGLTMNCARCHNHKFDPVSIKDYYSMTAVFQDVEFGSRLPEFSEDHPRRRAARALWKEIFAQRKILRDKLGHWEEEWGGYREAHWKAVEAKGVRITFSGNHVFLDEVEIFGRGAPGVNVAAADLGTVAKTQDHLVVQGRKIDRVNDGRYGTMVWNSSVPKGDKEKIRLELMFTEARTISRLNMSTNREYYFDTDYLTVKKGKLAFGDYRIEVLGRDGQWIEVADTKKFKDQRNHSRELAAASSILDGLAGRMNEEGPRPSFVGRFVKPEVTRVLHRGSPENPKDEVMPAAPAILDGELGLGSDAGGAERRKAFAEWMVRKDNPLTARVMANRIWHHVFGSGIVGTTSDFGVAGMVPVHPELLDWLACELMEPTQSAAAPWSMKTMIRLLVTTDAFKRSSLPNSDGLRKDADAAFLWRFPPQRVAAEVLRDGILQASGKLKPALGGRGYRIHDVKEVYAQWQVDDNHGEDTWRRMIYQERMRRVDDRIFTAFDFPDCGQVRAKRPVSTTPLQALNLMNSKFVVEQSGFIAERASKDRGTEASVRIAFQLLLLREPNPDELDACVKVAESNGLDIVCRSLINSNEFSFLP